ncbi:hypothetical protein H310_10026 [Aphanomyces invadans]|uniref:Uncharacterized protein n=1 Tax=Aphanomyces invadans TaxID=157072 RepID=A0A024TRS4_9STRA|nr:hypothetical protein H310_10026 [Aphanomyces invadans]ETV96709.1 hypothetical protein H310_10026 [Aphanomyces invadans]|eukprot:XP_008874486.1 hypothetical protein H310_10026 [Aphanomyces invadans]
MAADPFIRAYFSPSISGMIGEFRDRYHSDMHRMLKLQYLQRLPRNVYSHEEYAANVAVLDAWLLENGLTRLNRLLDCIEDAHGIVLLYAAYSGRMDVVECAFGCVVVTPAMMLLLIDVAAWRNHRHAMDRAATNGHFDVVRWLHGHGFEAALPVIEGAATNGHLDVVQWLHKHLKNGCTIQLDG